MSSDADKCTEMQRKRQDDEEKKDENGEEEEDYMSMIIEEPKKPRGKETVTQMRLRKQREVRSSAAVVFLSVYETNQPFQSLNSKVEFHQKLNGQLQKQLGVKKPCLKTLLTHPIKASK